MNLLKDQAENNTATGAAQTVQGNGFRWPFLNLQESRTNPISKPTNKFLPQSTKEFEQLKMAGKGQLIGHELNAFNQDLPCIR